jgi:hypothetical protein
MNKYAYWKEQLYKLQWTDLAKHLMMAQCGRNMSW